MNEVEGVEVKRLDELSHPSEDLVKRCTNYAMKSDILRLEIVAKFGGIYADVDSFALHPFGATFQTSFLSHRYEVVQYLG